MSYWLAEEPQAIAARLIQSLDDFGHLRQARIAWLFTYLDLRLHGGEKAAVISLPTVQGFHRPMFEWFVERMTFDLFEGLAVDFLVTVNAGIWSDIDAERRERLVYHELCHAQQAKDKYGSPRWSEADGRPILTLVPHDTEVFNDEIRRYGVDVCGLEAHAQAIEDGERGVRVRTIKTA